MPGYTPYTYPHPLTKGLPPPEQTTRNATADSQHDAHNKRRPWGGKSRKENKQKRQKKTRRIKCLKARKTSRTEMSQHHSPNQTLNSDYIASRNERILVSGSSGFIGSKVVETLLNYGFTNICCFVRPSSQLDRLEKRSVSSMPAK